MRSLCGAVSSGVRYSETLLCLVERLASFDCELPLSLVSDRQRPTIPPFLVESPEPVVAKSSDSDCPGGEGFDGVVIFTLFDECFYGSFVTTEDVVLKFGRWSLVSRVVLRTLKRMEKT